jgi:dihydrodipicolinate synthase/N-acetylneuraminate lyase
MLFHGEEAQQICDAMKNGSVDAARKYREELNRQ